MICTLNSRITCYKYVPFLCWVQLLQQPLRHWFSNSFCAIHTYFQLVFDVLCKFDTSGVTGGGRGHSAPRKFWPGNLEKKRRNIIKGKMENWKWNKGKVGKWNERRKMRRRFFFFFFFSLFKTTKTCFGSTEMEIFYREKKFHAGKKIRKMTLPPPYASDWHVLFCY